MSEETLCVLLCNRKGRRGAQTDNAEERTCVNLVFRMEEFSISATFIPAFE